MKYVTLSALVLAAAGGCGPDANRGNAHTLDLAGTDIDPNSDFSGLNFPTDDMGAATHDPTTCAEAETSKSYIGCDYWPTVTGNAVWSVFDYAVVVSNAGTQTANVTISGGALGANKTTTVGPGQLVKVGLPWVTSLKGADASSSGNSTPMTASVKAIKGAYHLVSDIPVLVYQFNALEYKKGTGNNLNGQPWSSCPAASMIPCDSYSNDASLLLPSTAMTPNYVVTGLPGDDFDNFGTITAAGSSYIAVTATADATMVTIQLSKTGDILKSTDNVIAAVAQNMATPAKVTYMLDAGDVIELVSNKGSGHDLTGSIVQGTKPIQVIVGMPCTTNPTNMNAGGFGAYTCDHVEETVLPVETWGKQYVVTSPTGPNGDKPKHSVRIYGGTMTAQLTFTPAIPGAPVQIPAGAVFKVDTANDFVVTGDHEFAVGSEQMSGEIVDPTSLDPKGDPAMSFMVAVEQFRDKYVFLAPDDYDVNFADVVAPTGTALMLDGAAVTTTEANVGLGFSVRRVKLTAGNSGAHTLTGAAPVGIQVIGYGSQTSYQYPGGLDLKVIAPSPPIL